MRENWKNIPGYDGKYQADTEGNIRRIYRSGKTRLMTPYCKKTSGNQRLVVKLTKDGRGREEILVQLIARTFLGPCPKGCAPYHKNGVQSDNYVQNIAYINKKELAALPARGHGDARWQRLAAMGKLWKYMLQRGKPPGGITALTRQ